MQPNVNEENVHNRRGMPPAIFDDIEDADLRAYNRGAILANIYERYVSDDVNGDKCLTARDFNLCSRDIDEYLQRMPRRERAKARVQMFIHLGNRGYEHKS